MTYGARLSRSAGIIIFPLPGAAAPCFVLEPGPLGDDGEETDGGAARPVEAGLPFAHRLLAGAQLRRHPRLAQAQVAAQRPNAGRFPAGATAALGFSPGPTLRSHAITLHGSV